jgi:hypothetical protein
LEGSLDGLPLGTNDGFDDVEGREDEAFDVSSLGANDGLNDGILEGSLDGLPLGTNDGFDEVSEDGGFDGMKEGSLEGFALGTSVGGSTGCRAGIGVAVCTDAIDVALGVILFNAEPISSTRLFKSF